MQSLSIPFAAAALAKSAVRSTRVYLLLSAGCVWPASVVAAELLASGKFGHMPAITSQLLLFSQKLHDTDCASCALQDLCLCSCLKSMIGESMDLPTQALALGYLSLSWGFGTILGQHDPLIAVLRPITTYHHDLPCLSCLHPTKYSTQSNCSAMPQGHLCIPLILSGFVPCLLRCVCSILQEPVACADWVGSCGCMCRAFFGWRSSTALPSIRYRVSFMQAWSAV